MGTLRKNQKGILEITNNIAEMKMPLMDESADWTQLSKV